MSIGSCHDLEHGQQVLSVAAHGSGAEVLVLSAGDGRVLVLRGHNTCKNTTLLQGSLMYDYVSC